MRAYVRSRCALTTQQLAPYFTVSAACRSDCHSTKHTLFNGTSIRRGFCSGGRTSPTTEDPSKLRAVDEILLRNEFEKNKDIRDYLRRWQECQPKNLDPIYEHNPPNPSGGLLPWLGNMLNDSREAYDAGSEKLRADDEDVSDFSTRLDEERDSRDFLEPGDLVGLSSAQGTMTMAVYVRSVLKQWQFYTARGKWRIASARDLDFVLKGFFPPELLEPLLPYLPNTIAEANPELQSFIEGGVPRPLGAPILTMLETFEIEAGKFYRNHTFQLDNIYDLIADKEERLEFTRRELTSKALALSDTELNDVALFAVHKALSRFPFLVDLDHTSLLSDRYLIQPKRVAKSIETVGDWVREHQEYLTLTAVSKDAPDFKDHPIQQFIQKAQRLIRLSRKIRSPTMMANVGPTAQRLSPAETNDGRVFRHVKTEDFSDTDRTIIEYLQLYCVPPRRMRTGIMRSAGPHIMRATGMYTSDKLIQDAWGMADLMKLDNLADIMQDLRKDWGDLPVFCVDSPDAGEIDDGVSLEQVPGLNDVYWIHIHVANPSAFIPHDNVITKHAASRYKTVYTPERTYHMLPASLTHSHFSLGPDRPTLTFSAKINTRGEVLETTIVNGYIRKVIYLTHEKLREFLDDTVKPSPMNLTVGGDFPQRSRKGLREQLLGDDKNTFRILRQLMLGFKVQREKNGAFDFPGMIDTRVSVFTGKCPPDYHKLDTKHGRNFIGDPIIQLQWLNSDPHQIPDYTKQDLISTLMNLAGWISGRWCADRHIPAVYDGTWFHPEYPRLTNENISKFGGNSRLYFAPPRNMLSSSVIPHGSIGVDAYIKSTSPLRRYTDLLAHHQIEAALRYENEHGQRLDATTHESVLPFSKVEIDHYINCSGWLRVKAKQCENASKQFWACQFLFRSFYFNECTLPETFPCEVYSKLTHITLSGSGFRAGYSCYMLPIGIRCQLLIPDSFKDTLEMLSIVDAKILAVDLSREIVLLEPVRLVKHFESYDRLGQK
ncbi:hypothetical protein V8E54_003271 [Elaphomyces granulatus]